MRTVLRVTINTTMKLGNVAYSVDLVISEWIYMATTLKAKYAKH